MNVVTIDFETFYDKDYSLSKLTTEEYLRDPRFEVIGVAIKRNGGPTVWFAGDAVPLALQTVSWDSAVLVAHNTIFDGSILKWHYGIEPLAYADTMSMARPWHGLTCGVSLAALAKEYRIGEKGDEVVKALGRRLADFTPDELAQYGAYCRNDVDLTWQLFKLLLGKTPKHELMLIDQTLRLFIKPQLYLDRALLQEHLDDVVTRKAKLLAGIEKVAGKDALMSNEQLAEVLQQLGVEPPTKVSPRTGKAAWAFAKTDKEFTDLLNHDDTRVQALVAARLGVKTTIEETRTERFIGIAERGAMPVPLNYAGAVVTLRHSGGDRLNLQNLNRGSKMRKAIMAPPGHVLVVGDSKNIELRVNHAAAGQDASVDAFRHGRDLYCEFASILYGREITPEDEDERRIGKFAHLSLGYGAGADKFREMCRIMGKGKVNLSPEEAERIVALWRETYDRIPAFWRRANGAIGTMLAGGDDAAIDVCGLVRPGDGHLVTPPGNRINYPGLCRDGDGFAYTNRGQTVKLYGGKVVENICIAGGTPVLTSRGWVPIEEVRYDDRVHDGVEFVLHGGAVFNGVRDCVIVDGVSMTPDHEVLTDEGWTPASQQPRPYRPDLRGVDCAQPGVHGRQEVALAVRLPVRQAVREDRGASVDAVLQMGEGAAACEVYDIVNCGPRRRFVVRGNEGPFIVHNCQHLARNIIAEQWLTLSGYYDVVLQVHDELVLVVPEAEVESGVAVMREVMSTSPAWWPDLPLDADVSAAVRYGDAK